MDAVGRGNVFVVNHARTGSGIAAGHNLATVSAKGDSLYACLALGFLSAQLVTDDQACKIPEDEWLRMYHHIIKKVGVGPKRIVSDGRIIDGPT